MARRYVAVWFPFFAIDRFRSLKPAESDAPFVLIEAHAHGPRIAALDAKARGIGLTIGRPLGEARAIEPSLQHEWIDEHKIARPWPASPAGAALDTVRACAGYGWAGARHYRLRASVRRRIPSAAGSARPAFARSATRHALQPPDTPGAAWMQVRWGDVSRFRVFLAPASEQAAGRTLQPDEATRETLRTWAFARCAKSMRCRGPG